MVFIVTSILLVLYGAQVKLTVISQDIFDLWDELIYSSHKFLNI